MVIKQAFLGLEIRGKIVLLPAWDCDFLKYNTLLIIIVT